MKIYMFTITALIKRMHPYIYCIKSLFRTPILLFLPFVCFGTIKAQQINRISASQGFTRNFVTSVSQDSIGYLWVGTNNALYRYDGYDFKLYTHEQGKINDLIDIEISFTATDRFGYTWIGTRKGLNRFDPQKETFQLWDNLNDKKMVSIHHTSDGYLILLTESGIYVSSYTSKNDSVLFKEQHLDGVNLESAVSAIDMVYQPGGKCWLATTNGLIQWRPDSIGSYPFSGNNLIHYTSTNTSLLSDHIKSIKAIDSSRLVLGTDEGVYLGDYSTGTLNLSRLNSVFEKDLQTVDVNSILYDESDLWIGSTKEGLIKYNLNSKEYYQFKHDPHKERTLGSNHIVSLFLDNTKTLWIATFQGGLAKLNTLQKTFTHINKSLTQTNSLSNNLIDGIYEDADGAVWVGTVSGLNRIELSSNNTPTPRISSYFINERCFDIVQDDNGYFYCSTDSRGLLRFKWHNGIKELEEIAIVDSKGTQYSQFSTIYIDSKGIFWMGLRRKTGLIRYNPNADSSGEKVIYYSGNVDKGGQFMDIAHIFEDGENNLWLASIRNGLFRIHINKVNRKPIRIKHFKYNPHNPIGISGDRIFSINQDIQGYIWVGVFGGGIIRLNQNTSNVKEQMIIYNQNHGLADNCVYGIIPDDDNNLWVSTHNGISKFSLKDSSFTSYDTNDGVQGANFRKYAFHKGESGRIYFGGINGLNIIEPDKVEPNPYKPRVAITALHIHNKKINVNEKVKGRIILKKPLADTKSIVLANSESSFSLDVTSFHYTNPNKNRIKYKLEEYDNRWINVGANERKITYSKLKAGTYTFKVLASNSNGVWTKQPVTLAIKILPPWWRSWWAYLIYINMIGLSLLAFRYYILLRQKFKHDIEAQKMQQQHMQEFNKAKLEFFTNITHEFKTPLTLIQGPIQDVFNSNIQLPSRIKKDLITVKNNSYRLMRLVNQLLDFRKMETGHFTVKKEGINLSGFIKDIVNSFNSLAESKKVYMSYNSDPDTITCNCDSDKIEKIIYNLVSNALKYVPEMGIVTVELTKCIENQQREYDKDIYWTIQDNLNEYVEIKVINTGKGIPKNDLANIFNRFYSQDEMKYNTESSSGIGLTLVHGLAGLLGAGLGVYSNDKETCFVFRLPYEQVEDKNTLITNRSISQDYRYAIDENVLETKNEGGGDDSLPIMLVADDHEELRSFIRRIFENHFNIIEASNGEEAYKEVLNTIPDIIISDVMMPVMDGLEFCKLVKTNDVTNHIPVILLTARSTTDQRIEGIEVGADSYIPKPFDVKHLKVRVRKLMELRNILASKYKQGQLLETVKKGISERDVVFLNKAEDIIKENLLNEDFTIDMLAQQLAFSRMQLYRKLKALVDLSPNEFIRNYRLKLAARLLESGNMNVTEVIYETGFSHKSYFTKCFKEMYGVTPKEYCNKG